MLSPPRSVPSSSLQENVSWRSIPFWVNLVFGSPLEKAGLSGIRFHDLRHSVASLLLSRGVHPKVVQEILGHSQIGITMDIYSHVLPSMHQDAMDKLDQAFAQLDEDEGGGESGGILARKYSGERKV